MHQVRELGQDLFTTAVIFLYRYPLVPLYVYERIAVRQFRKFLLVKYGKQYSNKQYCSSKNAPHYTTVTEEPSHDLFVARCHSAHAYFLDKAVGSKARLFPVEHVIEHRNDQDGYYQGREQCDCNGHGLIVKQGSRYSAHKDKWQEYGAGGKHGAQHGSEHLLCAVYTGIGQILTLLPALGYVVNGNDRVIDHHSHA